MKALKFLIVFAIAFGGFMLYRFLKEAKKSQSMQPVVGIENGQLRPCGNRPNCINSFESDKEKVFMSPLDLIENPISKIEKILKEKGFSIQEISEDYIWAIAESKRFKFIDDVEFYFDSHQKKLHFRSASRVGYSDMGVNKKRMQKLLEDIKN